MGYKMSGPSLYKSLYKKPVGPRATQKPVDHMSNTTLDEMYHNKAANLTEGTIEEQRKLREKNKNKNKKSGPPKKGPCWKGYMMVGTKKKGGRTVPNCVPKK